MNIFSKSPTEKLFDYGVFDDESFFNEEAENPSPSLLDLEFWEFNDSHSYSRSRSDSITHSPVLPINPTPPFQAVSKSSIINLPPLNLSRISQKSVGVGQDISKKKVLSEQSQSSIDSRKERNKTKLQKGQKKDKNESLRWGGSLRNVFNDPYYDRSPPKSDPFYDGNSIDSFDLEYLSRKVHHMTVGVKGRSGYHEGEDKSVAEFSIEEEKMHHDEMSYDGSPSTMYKEEKESDAPSHFDLEYFTRMHDDSNLKSHNTTIHSKSDRWGGNSGDRSRGGKKSILRAQSVSVFSPSSSSVLSSDSIGQVSPLKSGKKGHGWTDALDPENDDCTVVSIASHHSSSLFSVAATTGKPLVWMLYKYILILKS